MRFSLVVLLLAARLMVACSCQPIVFAPLCQRIDLVKVLFIGTPLETNDDGDSYLKRGVWYRFSVEESFKGLPPGTREVIVDPLSGTTCQRDFRLGERHLVISYGDAIGAQQVAGISFVGGAVAGGKPRPDGLVIYSGVCGGTKEVEHAAEDVEFVRQYTYNPQPARITGIVASHAREHFYGVADYPMLNGATVSMQGSGGKTTTTTGEDGRFNFTNVSPGNYSLSAALAGFTPKSAAYDVRVPAHGCGAAVISMSTNAGVAGTVLREDGSPAPEVPVEMAFADPRFWGACSGVCSTTTDDKGRFRFSSLPAGKFVVGVRIKSAPELKDGILPLYWPGVGSRPQAGIIQLAPNEQRDGIVIRLGRPGVQRKIRVQVRWPDGHPEPETYVRCYANGHSVRGSDADAQGSCDFTLLEGVSYEFETRAFTSYRNRNGHRMGDDYVESERTPLAPGSGPAEVELVLTKPRPKR
jgi:hypothetical protein